MIGHGGSSASSYLADPTSPIPSHCASIDATNTVRVNISYIMHKVSQKLLRFMYKCISKPGLGQIRWFLLCMELLDAEK